MVIILIYEKEATMAKTASKDRKIYDAFKEKGFNLPLSTLVEGLDTSGTTFQEKTVLSYISQSGSSFWINTEVPLGSELKLSVDLPPRLSDGRELKLIIKGRVIFMEAIKNEKSGQRVSLKFDNKYIIEPEH